MGDRTVRPVARLRAGLLAAALALAALLPAAAPAAGASITFGTPTATATYDQSIDFSVDLTTSSVIDRVELWLRFPDTIGPYVVGVDYPGTTGTQSLHYSLDLTGAGHLVPNTRFTATWAAYPSARAEPVLSKAENVSYQDTSETWRTVKGSIVTVHWYDGSEAFARHALAIGEQAIKDTADRFGVTETKPIDFFIYADDTAFRRALGPGTRENVGGQAHADIRTLFALITPAEINAPWVGVVIPHELVHLVFDTAVNNPYRFPPRWVNEGLAVYLTEGYAASDRSLVSDAVQSGDLMPLEALTGQFPTEFNLTALAYAESVSAIDYLVRTYGEAALSALVTAYKDGVTDDEAFTQAVGVDVSTFQDGWLAELGAQSPQQYGPQPEPPGPVPDGWSGPVPTAGAAASPAAPAATPPVAAPTTSPAAGSGLEPTGTGSPSDPTMVVVFLLAMTAIVLAGAGTILVRRGDRAP